MFQTFDMPSDAGSAPVRTKQVRDRLRALKIDAFIVPRADAHQGEYVPASADRLRWLTGFSGSAGTAVVTLTKACLFTDGRYTLQARNQLPAEIYEIVLSSPKDRPVDWLIKTLRPGAIVGFDPWLHTIAEVGRMQDALREKGLVLKPVVRNPVDQAWGRDQPAPPVGAVSVQPLALAGTSSEVKIGDLQHCLMKDNQDAVVLTLPDTISWLFNIRGADIPRNPVVLAFAIVPAKGKPELFITPAKLDATARAHLASLCKISAPEKLAERLASLRLAAKRVRVDPETAAAAIARMLGGRAKIAEGPDPCIAPKAAKTSAELAGARAAQLRDGAAMARFLAWLDARAPSGLIDEIGAVEKLEACRAETGKLRELSFDTISGSGENGAIVHYRVTTATNRTLQPGELFLVDSGGQYIDGTTDVTRTIAIGKPTAEMQQRYTLVLKGHIAIATARFPKGTRGIELDPFARRALWLAGLDFDHGTGHGVGSYLSVHEGPQSISKRGLAPLEPGMICSNEPGYYKEGAYGIRLENLEIVTAAGAITGGDRPMMSFERITFVPFDRRLIVTSLLDPAERAWVDAYHDEVTRKIAPLVEGAVRDWLVAATAPL
jgi:Xaa-Pro aminopeptidase